MRKEAKPLNDSPAPKAAADDNGSDHTPEPLHLELATAQQLIEKLQLEPHPEGGYFREIYRSANRVAPADGRGDRAGLTVIYYLLQAGQASRWHRVRSDELWHFLAGQELQLLVAPPDFQHVAVHTIGPSASHQPLHVVAADHWQAANCRGGWCLVSCSVGPGFDFSDFQLLSQLPQAAKRLALKHPEWLELL
jgi:predicted cupin superfamily sugar epimerase